MTVKKTLHEMTRLWAFYWTGRRRSYCSQVIWLEVKRQVDMTFFQSYYRKNETGSKNKCHFDEMIKIHWLKTKYHFDKMTYWANKFISISSFCSQHHGPNMTHRATSVPFELTCVAENMIPRIILRFLQHLRINTVPSTDRISPAATLEK